MKHATATTLVSIGSLVQQLRRRERLVERTPGAFYFRSKAFLHFHQDLSGIYADVKQDLTGFTRMRCTSRREQNELLRLVDLTLMESGKRGKQQHERALDSGSELQRRDVRALLAPDVDWRYVADWAARLGVDNLWDEIRK